MRSPERAACRRCSAVPDPTSGGNDGPRRCRTARRSRGGPPPLGWCAPGALGGARVIVDAHQHFWDPTQADYPSLTEDVAPYGAVTGPKTWNPCCERTGSTGHRARPSAPSPDETEHARDRGHNALRARGRRLDRSHPARHIDCPSPVCRKARRRPTPGSGRTRSEMDPPARHTAGPRPPSPTPGSPSICSFGRENCPGCGRNGTPTSPNPLRTRPRRKTTVALG